MPRKATRVEEETGRAPRRQVSRRRVASRTKRIIKTEEKTETEPRKIERKSENNEVEFERKAPTRIDQTKRSWQPSKKLVVTSLVLTFGLVATLWIGFSDQGQIDVSAKIVERNNEIMAGVDVGDENSATIANSQVIPVQNTNTTVPNGGLRGRGVGTSKVSQPDIPSATSTSTSTASSTSDMATSTEEVSGDEEKETNNETSEVENDSSDDNVEEIDI